MVFYKICVIYYFLTIPTNDVSVQTNKTDRYENQSVKWLIFFYLMYILYVLEIWYKKVEICKLIYNKFKISLISLYDIFILKEV